MSGLTVGITGYARTGKDTIAAHLVSAHGYRSFSLADGVRDALLALDPWVMSENSISTPLSVLVGRSEGWEGLKQGGYAADVRRLLQKMGTDVGRALDPGIWVKTLEKRIEEAEPFPQYSPNIVVPDVRFLNEADHMYHIIRVHRPGVEPANSHASETEVDQITPHDVIVNDGSIEDLNAKVDEIVERIF